MESSTRRSCEDHVMISMRKNIGLEEEEGIRLSKFSVFGSMRDQNKIHCSVEMPSSGNYLRDNIKRSSSTSNNDLRNKVIHSIKVGVSLLLVSLLYLLDTLYHQVGDNAMWAIMTVVVIFEFYAGATLGKGLNRGLGTILGGGLGCLVALAAQQLGGLGNSITIATFVFLFGGVATYLRLNPTIKKRYDYGVMIFILTFNLVVVSGVRAEAVLKLARDRLLAIVMGFIVCISVSLLVFPLWTSDELHQSTISRFHHLADSIQGCLEEYFELDSENKNKPGAKIKSTCKSVLNSKSKDESQANFAKWEPWHGRFGYSYPWDKYLRIGELLRELAVIVLSMATCLQSSTQFMGGPRESMKEAYEAIGTCIAWSLREVGDSIKQMRKLEAEAYIIAKMKAVRIELKCMISSTKIAEFEDEDALAMASLVFLLTQVVEKVEELAKQVEELGQVAAFHSPR